MRGGRGCTSLWHAQQLKVQSVLTSDWCNNVWSAEATARGQGAQFMSSLSPRTKPDGLEFWNKEKVYCRPQVTKCSQIQYTAALISNRHLFVECYFIFAQNIKESFGGRISVTATSLLQFYSGIFIISSCITTTVDNYWLRVPCSLYGYSCFLEDDAWLFCWTPGLSSSTTI